MRWIQSCLIFPGLHCGGVVGTPLKRFMQNINAKHKVTASNIFQMWNKGTVYIWQFEHSNQEWINAILNASARSIPISLQKTHWGNISVRLQLSMEAVLFMWRESDGDKVSFLGKKSETKILQWAKISIVKMWFYIRQAPGKLILMDILQRPGNKSDEFILCILVNASIHPLSTT